jgi:predicted dehydrogenase
MITRREFLPALALQQVKLPKKVRVAMVGMQGHPSEITGPAATLPDIEIVALWEPDAGARAAALRRGPTSKAKVYENWVEMLDREKPDIAAIGNAADERAPAILEATKRGIHWIAEKPIADTTAELKAIREAVAKQKVGFSMLLPMRFSPQYLALKRIVDSGAVGEVAQISSQKSYTAGDRPAWMKSRKSYGGTIHWIGIHMIDLMRWSSGREFTEVVSMQGQVGATAGIGAMENTTASLFRLDNKGVATLHMDYYRPQSAGSHGDDRMRLAGPGGVAEYLEATGVTLIESGKKPRVIQDLPAAGSVFVDFLRAVYLGEKQTLTHADVFRTTEIAILARDSAEAGRAMKL